MNDRSLEAFYFSAAGSSNRCTLTVAPCSGGLMVTSWPFSDSTRRRAMVRPTGVRRCRWLAVASASSARE
ncbi:hypothetical protein D3C81_1788940 [compost metagenome]